MMKMIVLSKFPEHLKVTKDYGHVRWNITSLGEGGALPEFLKGTHISM